MKDWFKKLAGALGKTIKHSPVEAALSLFFAVFAVLCFEEVIEEDRAIGLALFPIALIVSYLLNNWLDGSGPRARFRWIYYVSFVFALPFLAVDDLEEWIPTAPYFLTLTLSFLALFTAPWKRDNKSFMFELILNVKNVFVSWLLIAVAFGLTMAIYATVVYVFQLEWSERLMVYLGSLFGLILLPVTFVTVSRLDREREPKIRTYRFVDILLNYIITPALLAYTLVLYAYFVKIAVQWELPAGGLAWMIFAFGMLAVLAKALQPFLGKQVYGWFFDNFCWFAIPALLMFWIGTGHRCAEYGLTEWRIYLLICGVVMTAGVLMFLPGVRKKARYTYLLALTAALPAVVTYIPGMQAKDLAMASQEFRLENNARALGLMDPAGRFILSKRPDADTAYRAQYKALYNAFEYVYWKTDTEELHERYGVGYPSELKEQVFPEALQEADYYYEGYTEAYADAPEDSYVYVYLTDSPDLSFDISGFSRMGKVAEYDDYDSDNYRYVFDNINDILQIRDTHSGEVIFEQSLQSILDQQLRDIPWGGEDVSSLEEHSNQLLTYDRGPVRVIFRTMDIRKDDDGLRITDLSIECVLVR